MQFKNNLSNQSQPWAKEVEKKLKELEKQTTSTGAITQAATSRIVGVHEQVAREAQRVTNIEVHASEVDQILYEANQELGVLNNETLPALQQDLEEAEQVLTEMNEVTLPGIVDDLVDVQSEVATATQNAQDAIDAALAAETTASGANARIKALLGTATYAWTGTPGESESVKYIDGVEVARNYIRNPSYETSTAHLLNGSAATVARTNFPNAVAYGTTGISVVTSDATFDSGSVMQDIYGTFPEGHWVAFRVNVRRSGEGVHAARLYARFFNGNDIISGGYLASKELDEIPNSEQEPLVGSILIPPGADRVRLWILPTDTPTTSGNPGDGSYHTDAWSATVAATQQEAENIVRNYFDGDTPSHTETINPPTKRPNGADLVQGDELMLVNANEEWVGVAVWNGEEWVRSQIVADSLLVPGSAGTTVIADGAITTDKITANAITAEKVAAQTLTADKLVISSGENLLPWNPAAGIEPHEPYNANMQLSRINDSYYGWALRVSGGTGTAEPGTMQTAVTFNSGYTARNGRVGVFDVIPGETYHFSMYVGHRGTIPIGERDVRLYALFNATDWTYLTSRAGAPVTTYISSTGDMAKVEMTVTVPADAYYMRLYLQHTSWSSTNYSFNLSRAWLRKVIGATLIEDGAISTDKIAANAVTSAKIVANAVNASKIAAEAVNASKIASNAVTADKIAANAVTADKVQANAIDGKVITGATIRTSAGTSRTQMTNNGIQVFVGGTEQVRIGHGISTGMSVRNPASGTLTPLGPQIFGGRGAAYTTVITPSKSSSSNTWGPWTYTNPYQHGLVVPSGRLLIFATLSQPAGWMGAYQLQARVGVTTSTQDGPGLPSGGITWPPSGEYVHSGADGPSGFIEMAPSAAFFIITGLSPTATYNIRFAIRGQWWEPGSYTMRSTGRKFFAMPI